MGGLSTVMAVLAPFVGPSWLNTNMTLAALLPSLPWFDLLLFVVLIGAAVGGLRRGFTVEVLRYLGLLAGIILGAYVATRLGLLLSERDSPQRLLVGVAVFFVLTAIGQAVGLWVGGRLRATNETQLARGADAAGGAVIATLVCMIVLWLLGSTLGSGPSPAVARAVAGSTVLRTIDRWAPRPPAAIAEVKRLFNRTDFPDVFANLRPPGPNGPPPPLNTTPGITRAARSTVQIESRGCGGVVFGSGFPVGDGLFVTNAHVVAGTEGQEIHAPDGNSARATVVAFDPERDLAILRAPGMELPPLQIGDRAAGGDTGAVIGYPGGGDQEVIPARVASRIVAVGRDIYSRSLASREIYVLRSKVRKGDSGGPLVNQDGQLIGVVFAASTFDPNEGYALTVGEMQEVLEPTRGGGIDRVGVGGCAT
jgi:S1-C subfamily serine protease